MRQYSRVCKTALLNGKFEHRFVLDESFEVISHYTLAYAGGSSGEDEVADIQGEIIRDMGDDLIEVKDHATGITLLHQFLILVQAEIDIVFLEFRFDIDPFTNYGRIIPGLGFLPGEAFRLQVVLDIARREVDTHGNPVVVLVGEAFLDIFPVLADAQDQLTFVVELIGKFRIVERRMRLEERTLRLHEDHRFFRNIIAQFLSMSNIIPTNTENFHVQ